MVFDTSEDDKLSTHLSYQPNVVLLQACALIIESSKKSLVDVMDYARLGDTIQCPLGVRSHASWEPCSTASCS